uniref:(northern house mosquito) hypothetical protein n=1 Tax=Culex pipiens TaxID=7175 RepID=A0A8D8CBH3_CULPI
MPSLRITARTAALEVALLCRRAYMMRLSRRLPKWPEHERWETPSRREPSRDRRSMRSSSTRSWATSNRPTRKVPSCRPVESASAVWVTSSNRPSFRMLRTT